MRTLALSEGREFDKSRLYIDLLVPWAKTRGSPVICIYIYIWGHIWDGFMGKIEMEVEVESVRVS